MIAGSCGLHVELIHTSVACSCGSAMAPTVYVSDLVSNPSRSHIYPDTLDDFLGESVPSSTKAFPSILKQSRIKLDPLIFMQQEPLIIKKTFR